MTEPKIWPIGKAFAGFVAGFYNNYVDERYSYHGIPMECPKEPDPKPYDRKMMEEYGAKWEPIYERTNKTEQTYTLDYDVWAFKPAGKLDRCTVKFPDGFKRYYFCKVEIWHDPEEWYWAMDMNGILSCEVWSTAGRYKYFYKTYVATIWAAKSWLIWLYQKYPNSHFAVWRSTNGDMPVDYPIPIEEYHID